MLPLYGIFNFTLGLLFTLIAPFMLIIAKRNFRENQRHGAYSILITSTISLIIGIYFMVNAISTYLQSLNYLDPALQLEFVQESFYLAGLFPYNFAAVVLYSVPLFFITIGVFAWLVDFTEKRGLQKGEGDLIKTGNSLDLEISRKLFHIGLIAVLVCYIVVGKMFMTNVYSYYDEAFTSGNLAGNFIPFDDFFNNHLVNYEPYMGQNFILFAFIAVFFLLLLTDLVRIYKPKYYLLKSISRQWREHEIHSFGPHVHMLMGCIFVAVFFNPPIAAVALTITALGDGIATIIGVTKGKRPLKRGSSKTWEGAIAGFSASFILGFLLYFTMISLVPIYGSFYAGTTLGGIVISLVGAGTFFLIDYLSPPISDNILNPVICGCMMFLVSLLII